MAVNKKLLFVDTNIWLDFYRPRQSDVALDLLGRLEKIKDKIIVTHILEMEYKSHRQSAILEGLEQLNKPKKPPTLGIFSEAKASKAIEKHHASIELKLKALKKRLQRALTDPQQHDRVYQTCQRIFGRESELVFGIHSDRRLKRVIREKAMRRFMLGCPPRKSGDTSIGDAINWEWMVRCADEHQAELVILTRDSDYGPQFEQGVLLNDHLRQEFKERVSKKRDVLVYKSASAALKHFHVPVPLTVEKGELDFISKSPLSVSQGATKVTNRMLLEIVKRLGATGATGNSVVENPYAWLDIDHDEPSGVADPDEFEDLSQGEDKGR